MSTKTSMIASFIPTFNFALCSFIEICQYTHFLICLLLFCSLFYSSSMIQTVSQLSYSEGNFGNNIVSYEFLDSLHSSEIDITVFLFLWLFISFWINVKDPKGGTFLRERPCTQGSVETTRTDVISKRFIQIHRYLGRQSLSGTCAPPGWGRGFL